MILLVPGDVLIWDTELIKEIDLYLGNGVWIFNGNVFVTDHHLVSSIESVNGKSVSFRIVTRIPT